MGITLSGIFFVSHVRWTFYYKLSKLSIAPPEFPIFTSLDHPAPITPSDISKDTKFGIRKLLYKVIKHFETK